MTFRPTAPRGIVRAARAELIEREHAEALLYERLYDALGFNPHVSEVAIRFVREADQAREWRTIAENLALLCRSAASSIERDSLPYQRSLARDLREAFAGQCAAQGVTP